MEREARMMLVGLTRAERLPLPTDETFLTPPTRRFSRTGPSPSS